MRPALVLAVAALALALPVTASAAPPANDSFATPTSVGSVPFSDSTNLDDAGVEAGEQHYCNFKTRSVWYRLEASVNGPVSIDLSGSSPGVVGTVYRHFGGGVGNLGFEGCIFGGGLQLTVQPSGTYYIQVSDSSSGSASVQLGVEAIPPPPNDAFAAARAIGALPYSDVVTMLASTVEQDEPAPAGSPFVGSAWWTFTASASERLQVDRAGCCGNAPIHVYTGGALGSLDEVSVARGSFGRLIFQAVAGTTYRLQLGHDGGLYGGGLLGVSIQKAPIPSTAIFWSPLDPSSYDAVQFSGHAFDPAGFPIESWSWTFGDGGSAEDPAPSHRYFADGDYEVTMTATTSDGRSASTRTTVSIRTHDVGISKLAVPTSAALGKTKTITVEVVSAFASRRSAWISIGAAREDSCRLAARRNSWRTGARLRRIGSRTPSRRTTRPSAR